MKVKVYFEHITSLLFADDNSPAASASSDCTLVMFCDVVVVSKCKVIVLPF